MLWSLLFFLLIFFLIQWYQKMKFHKMRAGKALLRAEVVKYINQKSPLRNDFTKIPYPYVSIDSDNLHLIKLNYANSMFKSFKIGEQVDVFYHGGVLYYWHAYDRGLTRFLPV